MTTRSRAIRLGRLSFPGGEPPRRRGWNGGLMDRTIDSAATQKFRIGGVYDYVYVETSDVINYDD